MRCAVGVVVAAFALFACTAQQQNQTQSQVQQAVRSIPSPVKRGASDAALTAAVESAIAAQAGVNVFHVAPTVHNGVVTLKGTVPSDAVKATILSTVHGVHGVTETIDQMVVRR